MDYLDGYFGVGKVHRRNPPPGTTLTRGIPEIRPVLSPEKTGTIFMYNFVAGGEIVPQKWLGKLVTDCDRIEKDGWDRRQGQKCVTDSVYL